MPERSHRRQGYAAKERCRILPGSLHGRSGQLSKRVLCVRQRGASTPGRSYSVDDDVVPDARRPRAGGDGLLHIGSTGYESTVWTGMVDGTSVTHAYVNIYTVG